MKARFVTVVNKEIKVFDAETNLRELFNIRKQNK